MRFKIETDSQSQFRIIVLSKDGTVLTTGDPTHPRGIATLQHQGKIYIAVSGYFGGEAFKAETVYELKAHATELGPENAY